MHLLHTEKLHITSAVKEIHRSLKKEEQTQVFSSKRLKKKLFIVN
jgi:hypothetical protein